MYRKFDMPEKIKLYKNEKKNHSKMVK